jgi:hypothetical protein
LIYLLAWVSCSRTQHRSNAETETSDHNDPGVRSHQSIDKAALEHSPRRQANDANAQTSVHECIIQVGPFERRHTTIFASFPVEHEVDCLEQLVSSYTQVLKGAILEECHQTLPLQAQVSGSSLHFAELEQLLADSFEIA